MNISEFNSISTPTIFDIEKLYKGTVPKPLIVTPIKEKPIEVADILSIKDNKLVIDLEMLDGIEIKGSSPKVLNFLSTLILQSEKHIFVNSNFDDTKSPKKYKIWFNTEDPNTGKRVENKDLENYAELQYSLEKNNITSFSYKHKCLCNECGEENASRS
jgi:hypothetical protein